uniref:Uncharacterized protein n=1 Tax=Caenorhabditis japonica TaxID=281687 RepID=A0A8R1E364_CAEJA
MDMTDGSLIRQFAKQNVIVFPLFDHKMSKTFIGKRAPQFKTQAVVDGDVLQRESTWSDVSTCFEMSRLSNWLC